MNTDIRTDISPSIHPGALQPFHAPLNVEGTVDRDVLHQGTATLAEVYATIGKINDAVEAYKVVAPKATRVVQGRATEVALPSPDLLNAADRAFQRTAKIVDDKTAAMERSAAAMEQRIADALFDPLARTPLGADIRSHVKNLTDEKRWEFVSGLVASGKKVDVATLLAAPGYLSGLSDEAYTTLRTQAADRFAPTDHRQLTATRAVIDRVGQASGALFAAFVKVRDKSQGPVAQASAAIRSLG